MILKHALQALLRKNHRATNIRLQRRHELIKRLLHERLLGAVLDAEDGDFELQAGEGLVLLDVREGFLQVVWGRVRGETLEHGAGVLGAKGFDQVVEGFRSSSQEGDGHVAMGGMGEDTGDALKSMVSEMLFGVMMVGCHWKQETYLRLLQVRRRSELQVQKEPC